MGEVEWKRVRILLKCSPKHAVIKSAYKNVCIRTRSVYVIPMKHIWDIEILSRKISLENYVCFLNFIKCRAYRNGRLEMDLKICETESQRIYTV